MTDLEPTDVQLAVAAWLDREPASPWPPEILLRCVPFTNQQIEAAIRCHERSECGGACRSAAAGREVLRLRRLALTERAGQGGEVEG